MKRLAVVLGAVALAVLAPGAAYAATTGWYPNNACYVLTVNGCKVVTSNSTYAVSAVEQTSCPGDVGLQISTSAGASWWNFSAYGVVNSSDRTVTSFRVNH